MQISKKMLNKQLSADDTRSNTSTSVILLPARVGGREAIVIEIFIEIYVLLFILIGEKYNKIFAVIMAMHNFQLLYELIGFIGQCMDVIQF